MEKTLRFLAGRDFLVFLTAMLGCFVLIEKAGLFREVPVSYREILYSLPMRALSGLFAVNAVSGLVMVFLGKSKGLRAGTVLFYLSLLLLVVGLWVSIQTRFEGKVLRAEGESFNAFISEYVPQTVYLPKQARGSRGGPPKHILPKVGMTFLQLMPETSEEMGLKKVRVKVLVADWFTGKVGEKVLDSSRPFVSDWTFVSITDFGYAVKYSLADLQEREVESYYQFLKLFPPGAEDSFETTFLGYLFSIRCYPDYVDDRGAPKSLSAFPKNPVYKLRIVRNKDIVYNDLLKPTQKLRFDNMIITLPDVKMWVELTFVRDLGLPFVGAAIVLMIVSVAVLAWQTRRLKAREENPAGEPGR